MRTLGARDGSRLGAGRTLRPTVSRLRDRVARGVPTSALARTGAASSSLLRPRTFSELEATSRSSILRPGLSRDRYVGSFSRRDFFDRGFRHRRAFDHGYYGYFRHRHHYYHHSRLSFGLYFGFPVGYGVTYGAWGWPATVCSYDPFGFNYGCATYDPYWWPGYSSISLSYYSPYWRYHYYPVYRPYWSFGVSYVSAPVYPVVYRSYAPVYSRPYVSAPVYYEDVDLGPAPAEDYGAAPVPETAAPEAAEPEFDAATLGPVELQFVVGLSSLRSGDWDRAVETFGEVVDAAPAERVGHLYLAHALFMAGRFETAGEELTVALSGWDDFAFYPWNLEKLYGDSKAFTAQLDALEDAVGKNPQNPWLQLARGVFLTAAGEPERARASFEILRAREPWPELSRVISAYLERTANPESARAPALGDPLARFLESSRPADVPALGLEPK